MYVHRAESTYGRLVAKPKKEGEVEEVIEENVPIQDQIENLRTKIALKERYNKVLNEEYEESRKGTTNIIQELYYETRELRIQLMEALTSEQAAVQHALRTQRTFQLAMTDRSPAVALPWLEDKLFDIKTKLNALLDRLNEKRKKLEDAEHLVLVIEKWPRPGTLPWEVEAVKGFEELENIIEVYKIKRETAAILHNKYHEIRILLHEEKGKYAPTLRFMENQLNLLKNEAESLRKMRDEAYVFFNDAEKDVVITETEASENRKFRRKQMAKIKKSVEKVLAENELLNPNASTKRGATGDSESVDVIRRGLRGESIFISHILDTLKMKKEEVAVFQNQARKLVEIMRVPNLTYIPERLRTVRNLGEKLKAELESKDKLRDLILRQKSQVTLIKCHYQYTGHKAEATYTTRKNEFIKAIATADKDLEEAHLTLHKCGDLTVNLRLGIIALLERLDQEKDQSSAPGAKKGVGVFIEPDLKSQMKFLLEKVKKLTKTVESFEALFGDEAPERNYAQYVKAPTIPDRLIRVGSAVQSEESEEEDIPDSKVPNNAEIKSRSQKAIQQALLKRGLS